MPRYKGQKKPLIPSNHSLIDVLPLKVSCQQAIAFIEVRKMTLTSCQPL